MTRKFDISAWCVTLVTVMCCLSLSGCLGVGAQRPADEVVSTRVTQQTEHGARVLVQVAIDNPNDFVLPLREAHYTVRVAGLEPFVFTDVVPDRALPPNSRQILELPAAFATDGQPIQGKTYNITGRVTYEPPGELRAIMSESGLPLPSIHFSGEGVLE